MFKPLTPAQENSFLHLPAAYRGFTTSKTLSAMDPISATVFENWFPRPDGPVTRDGYVTHVTACPFIMNRLHVYAGTNGGESLWGTAVNGVYDLTTAGACPAASIALTSGNTISTSISTGAGSFMLLVNGVDTAKLYDGTTWSSIATFGLLSTTTLSYVEVYRQRVFFAKRSSLELEYLAPNSIAGASTNYPLGALFKLGGYIAALGTWTVDSGTGPDDNFAIFTSKGEVAVFAGSDPATWSLRGIYFIGRPLGETPLYKYGGDLLLITETGVVPLSSALQSSAVDRTAKVTDRIRSYQIDQGIAARGGAGWQIISDPLKPFLLLNIPSIPVRRQAIMNAQTGDWGIYTGWDGVYFARMTGELYCSAQNPDGGFVVRRITGFSDDGANITATLLQAYNRLGNGREKKIEVVKPYFQSNSAFAYNLGVSSDFKDVVEYNLLQVNLAESAAIWGASLWGAAYWTGGENISTDWQTPADNYSVWKGLYLQVVTNKGSVTYIGADLLYKVGGNF